MTRQTRTARSRRRKQTPENARRADWADRAVMAYQIATGTDREDAITDLLCDLMHLCDAERSSFNDQLTGARMHYDCEVRGDEPGDGMRDLSRKPRRLKLIAAIHGFMTAREAADAKPDREARDDRTYHVVSYGPQRFILGYIVDERGQEVTELRDDDDVAYCA